MLPREGRRPNFFLVGPPKAGTTSLHDHLSQHPDIFMSPLKETMHFAEEMRPENFSVDVRKQHEARAQELRDYFAQPGLLPPRFSGIVTSREEYLRLFEGACEERVVGEATPSYLWSKTAARGIAAFAPEAKVMMVLRNPVDRLFSQYLQMWNSGGYSGSFDEYILGCRKHQDNGKVGVHSPGLELGLYAEQLQRYREVFPAEQIGVWLYEESRKPGVHASVFRFLGVEERFMPDVTQRHLQQRVPRVRALQPMVSAAAGMLPRPMKQRLRGLVYRGHKAVRMGPRERSTLTEFYARDVERLEKMLERDLLGLWLRCDAD